MLRQLAKCYGNTENRVLNRVGAIFIFMKKLLAILSGFLIFSGIMKAQVTVETFPLDPQSGSHNYFGVRVTLSQTSAEDVTVTGYVYDEGNGPNTNHPYSLTVTAGNLSAETAANFYETDPTASAVADLGTIGTTYAGVFIVFEVSGNILKFSSSANANTVLDQLETDYNTYNDDYDSNFDTTLTTDQLDSIDVVNGFDELQPYKTFENLFPGFISKRSEVESTENTWLGNNFSGTDPDDIDLTFDDAANTIFNSDYSFKIGTDVYQLTSSGFYINSVYQDDGTSGIMMKESNWAVAYFDIHPGFRAAGPFAYEYPLNKDLIFTDCKTNKKDKKDPITAGNSKYIQKVAINYYGIRTSIMGKIVHYKNGDKKRAKMAIGVSGPVYNLSCSSLGNKSDTNPNGAGYKKRRALKARAWAIGPVWKTYKNDVGTSFGTPGGTAETFLLTW